jgi:hypothetical protein
MMQGNNRPPTKNKMHLVLPAVQQVFQQKRLFSTLHSHPLNELRAWLTNLWIAFGTFRIWTQEKSLPFPLEILPDISVEWAWDTRRLHFFFSYAGWSNLSQNHRTDQCTDHAYCQWHGSL